MQLDALLDMLFRCAAHVPGGTYVAKSQDSTRDDYFFKHDNSLSLTLIFLMIVMII